jgi:Ubiquitin-binding domain
VGQGIKLTPAFTTPLNKERFERWREEFWGNCFFYGLETRTSGAGHIWALLRSTLDADPQDAQAMLEASGMKIPQGSLTLIIDE